MIGRALTALFATALALSSAPSAPVYHVWPSAARQGEIVLVTCAMEATAVQARWFGEYHPLHPLDGRWWALLPVPIDAPVGTRPLALRIVEATQQAREVILTVHLRPLERPTQHLRMSREKSALYTAAEAATERRAIGAALRANLNPPHWPGPLRLPVEGRTSTGFGVRRLRNRQPAGWHRGLDLTAPAGTPVRAPAHGRVALVADDFKLHGRTIVLTHGGGLATLYLHLDRIEVARGDKVTAGQIIGRVGATGAATGPHLHWAAYLGGVPVNPLALRTLPDRP